MTTTRIDYVWRERKVNRFTPEKLKSCLPSVAFESRRQHAGGVTRSVKEVPVVLVRRERTLLFNLIPLPFCGNTIRPATREEFLAYMTDQQHPVDPPA